MHSLPTDRRTQRHAMHEIHDPRYPSETTAPPPPPPPPPSLPPHFHHHRTSTWYPPHFRAGGYHFHHHRTSITTALPSPPHFHHHRTSITTALPSPPHFHHHRTNTPPLYMSHAFFTSAPIAPTSSSVNPDTFCHSGSKFATRYLCFVLPTGPPSKELLSNFCSRRAAIPMWQVVASAPNT